jgi:DNA polymerase-3 subunit alpha
MPKMAALHCHSEYSPLDGCCSVEEMFARAKDLDLAALSVTDHGTLASHRAFQRAAKKYDLKPILGEELYFSETDRFDRRTKASREDGTSIYVHLIALAMNDNGLKNLQALDREAWLAYYYKPRMDFELLEQYNNDIIFTSACMGGLLAKAIERGDMEYAVQQANNFKDLLGDRYYIELQSHNPLELNNQLLELADSNGIKCVIAEDSHYAYPEQRELQELFLILSTHPKQDRSASIELAQKLPILERFNLLYPGRKMTFEHLNLFIGGYDLRKEELLKQGINREDLFANTLEVAARIEPYTYYENLDTLPNLYDDVDVVLNQKVKAGLIRLGLYHKEDYIARAEHEIKIIIDKKFSNYFLILEDVMVWAKKKGIRIGRGRGSAAGSLVCYALDITAVDPLEHHLLFERFLDPERPDWPDVDIDVQDDRRDELKKYLGEKYGYVAGITNILTYKGKKALKDAARAFGVPFAEVNKTMKVLNGIDEITGHDVIQEFEDSQQTKEFNAKYPDVVTFARQLYGKINGYGTHAAGFIITKQAVSEYAPVETRKVAKSDDRVEVVALDKGECESLGLIKVDFLGLSNLTVVDNAIKLIKETRNIDINIDNLSQTDAGVFEMLAQGKTLGVFQVEAAAYTKLIVKMGCKDFNDLTVSNALIRPGAWNAIGEDYIKAKLGKTNPQFIHEDVAYFMDETFGYPVYQEQMMKMSIDLAGFTIAEANGLRRGIGKKKREIIDKYKPQFIEGASKKIDKKFAEKLWTSFEESGAYAFVKSHAVSYSLLSYQTAWLKYHYPLEYMCALLRKEEDKDKVTDYLLECKAMGIKVKLPHINHSAERFTIDGDSLRMGLSGVKYISDKLAQRIIASRPYANYNEFKSHVLTKGSGLTTRVLQSLNAFGGASFDDNPRIDSYKENLYEYLGIPAFEANFITPRIKESLRDVIDFDEKETFVMLGMVKNIKRGDGWARIDIVDTTGSTGVFTDQDTPIVKGKMYLLLIGNNRIMSFVDFEDGDVVSVLMDYLRRPALPEIEDGSFKILAGHARKTKTNTNMAFLTLCNAEKELITVIVFDSVFNKAKLLCKTGSIRKFFFGKTKDDVLFVKDIY